jgi:hypothetical protein
MELLIIFFALIVFDFAAVRWGYDSRASIRSAEEWLASRGVTWAIGS